jgi:demethylmenaquinone methyltransferase/2-methoxy-6-polyprenyl-1,4-benzoquinol methylase
MNRQPHSISPVTRSKAQAKASYDRLSRFYDLFAGGFEQEARNRGLQRLQIQSGETVLEIGFETGHGLQWMAAAVGEEGRVHGIDLSSGMLAASRRRLAKAGLGQRATLLCGDASRLPYPDNYFDAVFSSFTLELFDTPEIPQVLAEIRRVLKPNGRVGMISMSKAHGASFLLKLYEWFHRKFPAYADCRPIYVERSIREAAFEIQSGERINLWGLPGEIVIGVKPPQA